MADFTCEHCKKTADHEEAMGSGWIPSYWNTVPADSSLELEEEDEINGPFCPDCVAALGIVFNPDTCDYAKPSEV